MTFAFPIWLLSLLPWTGVVAYLLRGVGQRTQIPFLNLWPRVAPLKTRSRLRFPPPPVMLMCLASLMAVLAAAGPAWTVHARSATDLCIVIDRGLTMSGDARYRDLISKCNRWIGPNTIGTRVTLIPVWGQSVVIDDGSWTVAADRFPPTALETQAALQSAINEQLRETAGPLLVLTDQSIEDKSDHVIQIAPDQPAKNRGIIAFAARSSPRPEVMVRLQNNSSDGVTHLRVRSGTTVVDRDVKRSTDPATEFIDMPAPLAETISAEIIGTDDIPTDDAAWLVRQPVGITLDVTGGVAAEVARIAAVYTHHRPAGRHILLTDLSLPPEQDGIQIIGGTVAPQSLIALTTANDPLTTGITAWPGPAADAKAPAGFRAIVDRDGHPLVAIHEGSPRQIWLNLNLTEWSRTTDFVVFFSNLFEGFRGRNDAEFTSSPPRSLGSDWTRINDRPAPANIAPGLWPGLYRSDDGRFLAINTPAPLPSAPMSKIQPPELPRISAAIRPGFSLVPAACWASLICAALALMFWTRRTL